MGHDVGQQGGYHETAQIDPAGALAHDHQHFVGQAFGQPHLGEDHADGQRPEDKKDRGVHEVLEGVAGRADKKKGLNHTDQQTGDPDGQHLKDPKGAGQQEQGQGPLGLVRQNEAFPGRVDGIRPGRGVVNKQKQGDPHA